MKKIMIVDDEPAIRELLVAVLQDEGYAVVAAPNGQQALELLPRERPDLVLLDIMMPDLDGREVRRRMQELPGLQDTQVIMSSAAIRPDLADSQIAAFVPKPFDIDQLLAVLDRVLGR